MENNLSGTFSIQYLRETLASTVGRDLIDEGFKINKSLNILQKKEGLKNKTRVFLDCYNYLPSNLQFRLLFDSTIGAIEVEKERLFSYTNLEYTGGATITLCEGDFHPKTRSLEPKLRSAFTHIVQDSSDMKSSIDDCRFVLGDSILPILKGISSVEHFQKIAASDYEFIARHNLVLPGILALKLTNLVESKKLFEFLWERLLISSLNDQHILKRLMNNIFKY